ncbi:MAG: hypothetical protein M0R32_10965 [Candidatus Cloacimonetes bacterium]|jgi:hypothetical protein|nr:hypothetical protein [Candidatus Cloacimonadota bacterium]
MSWFENFLKLAASEKSIWYHGTSLPRAKKILSEGLVPVPKEKTWEKDEAANFSKPSRASLPGVYLTRNLMTAISSAANAAGGYRSGISRAIVCVELQEKTLFADEDKADIGTVAIPGLLTTQSGVADLYYSLLFDKDESYLETCRKAYVEKSLEILVLNLKDEYKTKELLERIRQMLYDGWPIVLRRQAAYVADYNSNMWRDRIGKDAFLGINVDNPADYQRQGEEKVRQILDKISPFLDKASAENAYSEFIDKITRTMKCLAREKASSWNFNTTGRSTNPIGFKGSNKIVSIISLEADNDGRDTPKLLFGEFPQDFINQWTERISGKTFKT